MQVNNGQNNWAKYDIARMQKKRCKCTTHRTNFATRAATLRKWQKIIMIFYHIRKVAAREVAARAAKLVLRGVFGTPILEEWEVLGDQQ